MTTSATTNGHFLLLLIDDDPDIHALVGGMLRSDDIEVVSVHDGGQAVEVARREHPDLILLDYELPGVDGLEVLRRLRSDAIVAATPVIFVTGNDSHKLLAACFRAGAADYIRKPFCAAELIARVRSLLDRQQMLSQLERLAMHDVLTGLSNRASIRKRIQLAIDRASTCHYALLFLDIDRFKLVNDSLGHAVGDQLLQQVADRLRRAMRYEDAIARTPNWMTGARLGGDEFIVLLEGLPDPRDALMVADRLMTTLSDAYFVAGHEVYCSASIGVVTSAQAHATPEEVLRDADTAMYEAKSAGKGRYVLFDSAMRVKVEYRLKIENGLRGAIANGELFLEYQPIVSLESGRTVGFEALLRWEHPEWGLVVPADFIPTAEETGLIVPIGAWVLNQACQDFASWQRELGNSAPLNIHVNLSQKQLLLRDLVERVTETLKRHGVAPECLHLEITESEIMQNPAVAQATLEELRRLGIKIDMDDFGTGHSSLACLQELPIDVLKIDRSFVVNMERSHSFAALVHAVTNLGQNLGMTTVAEGIETADQLAMLQSMDCDFGQGYFFAKAMPADEAYAYLLATSQSASQPVSTARSTVLPLAANPLAELADLSAGVYRIGY